MIDPHVHLRDWNEREKETILHGMESGFLSGIDTFFDMPNTNPPLTSRDNILRRIEDGIKAEEELGKKGMDVHYHLYLGLTPERRQVEEMADLYSTLFPRVIGLKLFASHSTGNMGIIDEEEEKQVGKGTLLMQGIATSIDALSFGFTIANYNLVLALAACLVIAIVTFIICWIGIEIGKKFGMKLANKAAILGGVILLVIGLEIFIKGVFF